VQLLALGGLSSLASFHLQASSQGQPGLHSIPLPAIPGAPEGTPGGKVAGAGAGSRRGEGGWGEGRVAQESNQPLPTAFLSMLLRLILTHFSR